MQEAQHEIKDSWEDYSAGYRQAVYDLTAQEQSPRSSGYGILIAYFIGLILGAIAFKYTKE